MNATYLPNIENPAAAALAQEKEIRRHIARDIHDGALQTLMRKEARAIMTGQTPRLVAMPR